MLDEVHLLHNAECRDALPVLADAGDRRDPQVSAELGTLVGEAQALRARLSAERSQSTPRGIVADRCRAACEMVP